MRARRGIAGACLLLVALAPVVSGCFRRPFPERRQYVVSVERTGPARARSGAVIKIGRVRAEPQYDRKGFVYRTGELTYSDDFYNAFYVNPSQMVRSSLQQWLEASGLFATVADVDSLVGAGWLLESRLIDFYIDKRPDTAGRAVLRVSVTLVDAGRSPPRAILERTYEEAAAVSGSSGDDYVIAWSRALSGVYARLEEDLATILSTQNLR